MAKKSEPSANNNKAHPWNSCPIGYYFVREHFVREHFVREHFVREHFVRIPPSKKHPKGIVVIRHAHCRKNN